MRNPVLREIATQGHSRSFILQSVTGQQGVAYHHITLLALSLKSPKIVVNHPTLIWSPRQEEPPRISAYTLYFQKLRNWSYWPTFLLLIVWVYLYSILCSGLQKTHLFCNRVHFGRSRTFKIMQGRWFWYQSKARCDSISRSLWLWSYLAPFLRYGDWLAKNCLFFLPLSHSAPSLSMLPLEFRTEVNREETRVMGLSSSEDRMILAWVVLTQCQCVTDGQTEGRTDLL